VSTESAPDTGSCEKLRTGRRTAHATSRRRPGAEAMTAPAAAQLALAIIWIFALVALGRNTTT
jgi:hypothetical protein